MQFLMLVFTFFMVCKFIFLGCFVQFDMIFCIFGNKSPNYICFWSKVCNLSSNPAFSCIFAKRTWCYAYDLVEVSLAWRTKSSRFRTFVIHTTSDGRKGLLVKSNIGISYCSTFLFLLTCSVFDKIFIMSPSPKETLYWWFWHNCRNFTLFRI